MIMLIVRVFTLFTGLVLTEVPGYELWGKCLITGFFGMLLQHSVDELSKIKGKNP